MFNESYIKNTVRYIYLYIYIYIYIYLVITIPVPEISRVLGIEQTKI